MDLDLVFFGTSGSVPTAQRGPSALLVRRGGERLLFDCGEGTQRQMLRSSVGLVELREVFVSHFHADHYLGLPGMLKTFALRGRELPLTIYGPPGLKELFGALRRIFGRLTYPLELVELAPGDVLERGDYNLVTLPAAHAVQSLAFALVEDPRPGRFDVEAADALGVPSGPERGAAAARRVDHARGRPRSSRRTRCSGRRGRAARSCSAATPPLRRPCSRPRAGRRCWCTRRPSSTRSASVPRRPAIRPRSRQPSSPARRRSGCSR